MAARYSIASLATAGMATVMASAVSAQVVSPTREEIRRDTLTPDPQVPANQLAVDGEIERSACPLAQPQFANVTFQLNAVVFDNLSVISPNLLTPSYAEYVGQTVPVATVCDIRDRAATILRNEGYLSAVQVPPQQIGDDGVVRFDVLMARIARLQVRGDTGNSENLVESYLTPLTEAPVFNRREAERNLLLARQIPGYDTRLTLRPADGEPGQVIGDVRIERTGFVLEGNLQNYGPKSAGRFGGQIRAQLNDLTGLGDRTSIGFYSTTDFSEAQVLSLTHDFAIGGSGLRLGGEFTYAWNDPEFGGVSPFNTETLVATARLSYPLVLDQATQVTGTAGFEFIDQRVDFSGTQINQDNARIAFARLDASVTDRRSIEGYGGFSSAEPRWRFGVSAEARQGLDVFGASERFAPFSTVTPTATPQTRLAGVSDASVFRLEALAEFRPTPNLAFIFQPRAQITGQPLIAYEEFSGGNYTTGRGYDPGSVIGDNGFGFRSEIRAGSLIPANRDDLAIQPYAFFDAAWIGNEDPAAVNPANTDRLYSTGAGVRAAWGGRLYFDTALAIPLRRTALQATKPDPRLLMSLTLRFAR